MNKTKGMLEEYIDSYYSEIAQMIEEQQIKFGLHRIHGQGHIARSIIIAKHLLDLHFEPKDSINRLQVYLAISFHDIGRQGEGEDAWETASYDICKKYLIDKNFDNEFVNNTANLMVKKNELNENIYSKIVYDTDCYEIMRSSTGRGGLYGFDKKYLKCFKDDEIKQQEMINLAWKIISLTDNSEYENLNALNNMFKKMKNGWE
jgi:hypothetical protein